MAKKIYWIFPSFNFLLRAFVFMQLWNWFISATFGIVELNYVQAFGISLIVLFFIRMPDKKKFDADTYEDRLSRSKYALGAFCVLLGFGFVVNLFM